EAILTSRQHGDNARAGVCPVALQLRGDRGPCFHIVEPWAAACRLREAFLGPGGEGWPWSPHLEQHQPPPASPGRRVRAGRRQKGSSGRHPLGAQGSDPGNPAPGLGFCYSIIRGPSNATVLAGLEARFNCTVSEGWVILIWLSNGNPVLTVLNSQGAVETSDRFTSQNYTSSSGFTSELIIHKTQLSDSGKIECSIQQTSENGFAFLSVQVNGSLFIKNSTVTVKENKTVEIVCEAIGWAPAPDITWMTNDSFIDKSRYATQQNQGSNGLHNALSILTLTPTDTEILTCLADIEALPNPQNASVTLIFVNSTLGSTYQNEIRKVSSEKNKDGDLQNRQRHGSENQGYIPEELWNTEQSPGIASLPPVSSKLTVPAGGLHTSSSRKVGPQRHADYLISPKKIRNMTLV
uniref:Immunoglobulin superfamily member 5 n=1 Tax=Amazona collaria TaxID=241587 RepID=A0A8B9IY06_9PSIT